MAEHFNYLNNKHLIDIVSCQPGHKIPQEILDKMDNFIAHMEAVLNKYCDRVKFDVTNDERKLTWFLYQDLDLNLETVYVSGSNKFNKAFLLDLIKVVAFR